MERIVVGVDESAAALVAVRWAARQCRLRGGRLTAVMAWTYLGQHHGTGGDAFRSDYNEAAALAALDQFLAQADLAGVDVGSVSQHVLHHAPCVTVVVPAPE